MDQQEGETVTHRDTLKIIIRDFTVSCSIGVSDGERRKPQRLCLNLTLEVAKPTSYDDDFSRVVDYGAILGQIRRVVAGNDTLLLETLADRILRVCMSDERVLHMGCDRAHRHHQTLRKGARPDGLSYS